VLGLPLHPLIVHLAVVLLPLSALGAIAIAVRPAWSKRFGVLVVAGAAVGAIAAVISKNSGEDLAQQVGVTSQHLDYGNLMPLLAGGFLALIAVFWLFDRGVPGNRSRPLWLKVLAVVVALAAIVVIVWTALTGHSGAEAVWGSVGSSAAAAQ
jgi:uncharacterized membrane protein